MLTNDDIYKSRDASTSDLVAIMMELKYFDEQFLYYGLAYAEDGVIKYRLNAKPLPICQFQTACLQKGLFPTNITTHVELAKVPSGQEEAVAAQVREAFLTKLKASYPKALFQALVDLGSICATDAAQAILSPWQAELELCFAADEIALFNGLCQMAYAAKLLTAPVYQTYAAWAAKRTAQIQNCENVIWRDKRYFYGFLYWQDGQRRLYSNAELPIVMDHAYALKAQGIPCTPIHSKHYWFDAQSQWSIRQWREYFEADLQTLADDAYCQRFFALRALPSPISPQQFADACTAVDTTLYPQAAKTLGYYRERWLHPLL